MFNKTTFKLEPENVLGSGTDYHGFSFGCATEPKDGKIGLISGYHSCREGLMTRMRSRITGASTQPNDKMRMIFRFCAGNDNKAAHIKESEDWALRAVPVIQAFDKLAGWPLTRAYKIETRHDSWLRAYYFYSSRRWMKSSYLVSMYVMLMRMCKDTRIKGFKDFNGLVKVVQKCIDSGTNLKMDHSYVKASLPYWEAIMKGYPRLFRQYKLPYYWDTSRLNGGGANSEGLQYLVAGNTSYKVIREELVKIKKELETGTFDPTPAKKKSKK
jgi:hypothetical protein